MSDTPGTKSRKSDNLPLWLRRGEGCGSHRPGRQGGNAADAEDLLQTALSKLVRVWDRVAQSGDVDAYLRRVLVNTHVSRGRRRWHRERPTEAPPDLPGRDPYVTLDDRDQLRRALEVSTDPLSTLPRAAMEVRS
ncbi:MAG: hypothetical protein JJD92_13755 [Frankiaceae bacterium]|nr:hypothetical protein [Frankiaceae bacterium]